MARYRVGDKFLSESEYEEESLASWAGGLFLIGCILTGIISNQILLEIDLPKWLRFSIVVFCSILSGGLLAAFAKWIRDIIFICLFCGIVFVIGRLIWEVI
ncbi:hypothetical protein [Vibrio sp. K4]|uniref:hypothetical protein n=1 Tax=Vibrio sp. K4 TaxID=3391579 RepID=UPI003DA77A3A